MKIKIGDLVELYSEKCGFSKLSPEDVFGINKEKKFFSPTVQVGVNTANYKLVRKGSFACNLMHVGRDFVIPIAYNNMDTRIIVSPAYHVFFIKRKDLIIDEYFYMTMNKLDFDRYAAFCTDSSVRDGLDWWRFCDIEIDLPSMKKQKEVVDVYLALIRNQSKYEQGLDDLKLTVNAFIEKLRKDYNTEKIGQYLKETREINRNLEINFERGLNKEFGFVEPGTMSNNVDLSKRKIVRFNSFVYPPPHFGEQGTIGLNKGDDCIMSQMYITFKVKSPKLYPDYLFLWFRRDEFMRFGFFAASDSIRDTFDFEKLCEYKIPIPHISIQKDIADIFEVYNTRRSINEKLKKYIQDVCPILIKGSI